MLLLSLMPHERKRYLETILRKVMGLSPLVGVLGHRQVGKTTLISHVSQGYYSLDSLAERTEAELDPEAYIKKRHGRSVALDEVQLVPELFPALKNWVRTHPRPGQFLMSGSVRFTSRDAIRESLTGRIMNLELHPFSVSELESEELSDFCPKIMGAQDLNSSLSEFRLSGAVLRSRHTRIHQYYSQGGLPGVCFIREPKLRSQKIEEQLLTILDRDLRLVKKITTPFGDLKKLAAALADIQGMPLNFTDLRKRVGLSTPTIKKIIYALEAVFVLRMVPIEGSTQGDVIYFEDQAERGVLTEQEIVSTDLLAHFLFCNLRTQFSYRIGERVRSFQYRTRGGALVPICFASKEGVLGVLPIASPDEWRRHVGTVDSFLAQYSNATLLLVHTESELPKLVRPHAAVVAAGLIV